MTSFTFFLDVDNTLIDNDRVKEDLEAEIERLVGPARAASFWSVYEEIRQELDYVDLPRTLERFGRAFPDEPNFPRLAQELLCFPFERYLYPGALEAITHLKAIGTVTILSDGDLVFQPAKIARAGLADAVDKHVMIYVHKQEHLDEVTGRFPAECYVLVDDKPDILVAAKTRLKQKLVTVHVCQGKYAHAQAGGDFPPDIQVQTIAELRQFSSLDFRSRA